MKKTEASRPTSKTPDEMRSKYEFDCSKTGPNGFASRALIETMPEMGKG